MILRPVRPASPTGPPMTKRPVGLTRKFLRSFFASYSSFGRIGSTTCSQRSSGMSDSAPSLCCVEIRSFSISTGLPALVGAHTRPLAVLVADRHLRLAVGAQVVDRLGLAHRGEALGQLVRERDRERHQRLSL